MLGSQDPSIYLFSYHETLENSMDGVNAIVNPMAYQNIANPQTIYVRLTNDINGSYVLTSESTVTIFNLIGKKVFFETIIPQNERITLDANTLFAGVYFIKVSSEESVTVKRFIKK